MADAEICVVVDDGARVVEREITMELQSNRGARKAHGRARARASTRRRPLARTESSATTSSTGPSASSLRVAPTKPIAASTKTLAGLSASTRFGAPAALIAFA